MSKKLRKIANRFKIIMAQSEQWSLVIHAIDGDHVIGKYNSAEAAKEKGNEWLGYEGEWRKVGNEYVLQHDEGTIVVSRSRAAGKGKKLHTGWDHFFETGFGQKYIMMALGFSPNEYGELKYGSSEYKEWMKYCEIIEGWLMSTLSEMGIEAYGADNTIFTGDLEELANRATFIPEIGEKVAAGFRAWADDEK